MRSGRKTIKVHSHLSPRMPSMVCLVRESFSSISLFTTSSSYSSSSPTPPNFDRRMRLIALTWNRKGEIKMFRIGRDVSASTIVNSKKEFAVKIFSPVGISLIFSISAVFSRTQEKVSDLRERCSCHRCRLSVTCLGFPSWTFPGFLFYTPRFSCPTPERRFASIGRKKKMCHLISQNICTRNGSEN